MKDMFDLNTMMREITVSARLNGLELRGQRRFYWRMRMALWLFRMGAFVAGMGFEVEQVKGDRGMFVEKKRRIARIELSIEMLESLLQFPSGTSVERIFISDWRMDAFTIVVSHPSFPAVEEGEYVPSVMVIVSDENGRLMMNWQFPDMEEGGG